MPLPVRMLVEGLGIAIAETRGTLETFNPKETTEYILWSPTTSQAIDTIQRFLHKEAKCWIISKEPPLFSDLLALHLSSRPISILLDDPERIRLRSLFNWLKGSSGTSSQACCAFGFPNCLFDAEPKNAPTQEDRQLTVDEFTATWESRINYLYVVAKIIDGPVPELMRFLGTEFVSTISLSWNDWIAFTQRFDRKTQALFQCLILADGSQEITAEETITELSGSLESKMRSYACTCAAHKRLQAGDLENSSILAKRTLKTSNPTIEHTQKTVESLISEGDSKSAIHLLSTCWKLEFFPLDNTVIPWLIDQFSSLELFQLVFELNIGGNVEGASLIQNTLKSNLRRGRLPNRKTLIGLTTRVIKENNDLTILETIAKLNLCNQSSDCLYIDVKLSAIWQLIYSARKDLALVAFDAFDLSCICNKNQIKVLSNILLAFRMYEEAENFLQGIDNDLRKTIDLESYQLRLKATRPHESAYTQNVNIEATTESVSRDAIFWWGRSLINKSGPSHFLSDKTSSHIKENSISPKDLTLRFNKALALRAVGKHKAAISHFQVVVEKHPTDLWKWMAAFELSLTYVSIDEYTEASNAARQGCRIRSTMINNRLNPCVFLFAFLEADSTKNSSKMEQAYTAAAFCHEHWMAPQFGIQNWALAFQTLCTFELKSPQRLVAIQKRLKSEHQSSQTKAIQILASPESKSLFLDAVLKSWILASPSESFEHSLLSKLSNNKD